MDWTTLLFSFNGRINRGKYWLALLIYVVVWAVFSFAAVASLGGFDSDRLFQVVGTGLLLWAIAFGIFVASAWSSVATAIKRLHDRDRSGWWIPVIWFGPGVLNVIGSFRADALGFICYLAAFVVSVWAFVELGCLRGTAGPNPYGPDPLAERFLPNPITPRP